MTPASRTMYAVVFISAGAGFLLPFWPLCVLGILVATLSGRWFFGVCLGLLLDIAWGAPQGVLHYLYVPFTALALAGALIYYFSSSYFLDRTPTDTL